MGTFKLSTSKQVDLSELAKNLNSNHSFCQVSAPLRFTGAHVVVVVPNPKQDSCKETLIAIMITYRVSLR